MTWRLFEQGVRGNIFDLALEELKINDKSLVGDFVGLYRSHAPEITLLPDAKVFLESRKKEELALITDGYAVSQHAKIRALDLQQYFGKIVATDDWGREFWKPHLKNCSSTPVMSW